MKAKLIALLIAGVILGGLGSLPASASPQSSNSLGELVPLSDAKRTIRINARTRYVNVTEHETVKFEINGTTEFAIYFRGAPEGFAPYGFDLNQIAPPYALQHQVTVWVAPDPLYLR